MSPIPSRTSTAKGLRMAEVEIARHGETVAEIAAEADVLAVVDEGAAAADARAAVAAGAMAVVTVVEDATRTLLNG